MDVPVDLNKHAPHVVVSGCCLLAMPFWLPAIGGYIELGSQRRRARPRRHGAQFSARLYRRAVLRPCGLFRPRRLRRRHDHPLSGAEHGLGIVVGTLVGTIAAAIIGPLIVRLRGVYFAMVTIAFGQVFYFIAFRWNSVTGGDDGLTGWTRMPLDFGFASVDILHNPIAFYYFVLVVLAVAAGVMAWLLRSPFGRTLIAIRENERRARFLGIPVDQHIWISWVISCGFVSLAGALYALLNNFVDPRALYWTQSGDFVIMAVLGGMRSFWGPLIGAAIYRRAAGLRSPARPRTGCRSSACSSCWSCCSSRAACSAWCSAKGEA